MRVVAGKFKGHPLKSVSHSKTRPTSDKVKESLFHSIGPFFQGGEGLDLFAGSGGLGIEALSRGVDHVIFVDKDYQAIQIIKENIRKLKLEDSCEIYRNDAFRAIKAASKRGKQFDYVFLDPPYGKIPFDKLLQALHEANLLKQDALVICEHDQAECMPEGSTYFSKMNESAKTSLTTITFYRYSNRGNEHG